MRAAKREKARLEKNRNKLKQRLERAWGRQPISTELQERCQSAKRWATQTLHSPTKAPSDSPGARGTRPGTLHEQAAAAARDRPHIDFMLCENVVAKELFIHLFAGISDTENNGGSWDSSNLLTSQSHLVQQPLGQFEDMGSMAIVKGVGPTDGMLNSAMDELRNRAKGGLGYGRPVNRLLTQPGMMLPAPTLTQSQGNDLHKGGSNKRNGFGYVGLYDGFNFFINSASSPAPPLRFRLSDDWADVPLMLHAVDGSADSLPDTITAYLGIVAAGISPHQTADEFHAWYAAALRLVVTLHQDLRCPRQDHERFWKIHGQPNAGNFAGLLSRLTSLKEARADLLVMLRLSVDCCLPGDVEVVRSAITWYKRVRKQQKRQKRVVVKADDAQQYTELLANQSSFSPSSSVMPTSRIFGTFSSLSKENGSIRSLQKSSYTGHMSPEKRDFPVKGSKASPEKSALKGHDDSLLLFVDHSHFSETGADVDVDASATANGGSKHTMSARQKISEPAKSGSRIVDATESVADQSFKSVLANDAVERLRRTTRALTGVGGGSQNSLPGSSTMSPRSNLESEKYLEGLKKRRDSNYEGSLEESASDKGESSGRDSDDSDSDDSDSDDSDSDSDDSDSENSPGDSESDSEEAGTHTHTNTDSTASGEESDSDDDSSDDSDDSSDDSEESTSNGMTTSKSSSRRDEGGTNASSSAYTSESTSYVTGSDTERHTAMDHITGVSRHSKLSSKYNSSRHGGSRHGGSEHGRSRHGGSRHGGSTHGGSKHARSRHGGSRHGGSRHGGSTTSKAKSAVAKAAARAANVSVGLDVKDRRMNHDDDDDDDDDDEQSHISVSGVDLMGQLSVSRRSAVRAMAHYLDSERLPWQGFASRFMLGGKNILEKHASMPDVDVERRLR